MSDQRMTTGGNHRPRRMDKTYKSERLSTTYTRAQMDWLMTQAFKRRICVSAMVREVIADRIKSPTQ